MFFEWELGMICGKHRKHICQGPDYKKILRLSYDVIITYDNRKSNLRSGIWPVMSSPKFRKFHCRWPTWHEVAAAGGAVDKIFTVFTECLLLWTGTEFHGNQPRHVWARLSGSHAGADQHLSIFTTGMYAVSEKSLQYSARNFNRFKYIFIIFDISKPSPYIIISLGSAVGIVTSSKMLFSLYLS